jgi:hypothetical protein
MAGAPALESAMTPGPSCPVVLDQADGTAGRIVAFLALGVLAVGTAGTGWVMLGLAGDFALRGLGRPAFSPLARTAELLRRLLVLPVRRTDAGPKRFAAAMGCAFSLGVGLSLLSGFHALALGLAAILAACAGAEAFFGFCVACRLYPWLGRIPRFR